MKNVCLLSVAVLLIGGPILWADEGPPKVGGEGDVPRVKTEVVRGVLQELGPKGLALKNEERVVTVALPERMTDPLEAFLKANLHKAVALRVVRQGERLVLVGPAEGGPPRGEGDRPRGEGERPRGEGDRPRGEGERPRGEGERPRMEGDVLRGVLKEVRDREIVLKVGEGEGKLMEIALPEVVPPPLAELLHKRLNETIALRVRKGDRGLVLAGPAEMPPPPRPGGEGPRPERRDGEGPRPERPDGMNPQPLRPGESVNRGQADKIEQGERQARALAEQIRKTDDTEKREQLIKQLRELLSDLFELREAPKREQLERVQAEVERLRAILKLRAESKGKIVEQHLRDLVGTQGEGDVLHW